MFTEKELRNGLTEYGNYYVDKLIAEGDMEVDKVTGAISLRLAMSDREDTHMELVEDSGVYIDMDDMIECLNERARIEYEHIYG